MFDTSRSIMDFLTILHFIAAVVAILDAVEDSEQVPDNIIQEMAIDTIHTSDVMYFSWWQALFH